MALVTNEVQRVEAQSWVCEFHVGVVQSSVLGQAL